MIKQLQALRLPSFGRSFRFTMSITLLFILLTILVDPSFQKESTTETPSYTVAANYDVLGGVLRPGDELPWEKKKRPCDRSADERFEDEIVRGGCREEFVRILTAKIKQAFQLIPDLLGIRDMITDFITDNLSKFITDNVSGGNIAEFITLCIHVGTSFACFGTKEAFPVCNVIATQFKHLVRKIIFEALKMICRLSGCCVPGPDAECCGWENGKKVALNPVGPKDPMTQIFEDFTGAFLNIFNPFSGEGIKMLTTAFNPFTALKKGGLGKVDFSLLPFGMFGNATASSGFASQLNIFLGASAKGDSPNPLSIFGGFLGGNASGSAGGFPNPLGMLGGVIGGNANGSSGGIPNPLSIVGGGGGGSSGGFPNPLSIVGGGGGGSSGGLPKPFSILGGGGSSSNADTGSNTPNANSGSNTQANANTQSNANVNVQVSGGFSLPNPFSFFGKK